MDDKEKLRQLKESKEWEKLKKTSLQLHKKDPHDRYTVRMLVTAYEKLGEQDDAVQFWEILAKGENRPEVSTRKLVQYYKQKKDEKQWVRWSKILLSQSLRKKDYSTFEDTVIQLIERGSLDAEYIMQIAEKVVSLDETERALTILELSLLSLEERDPLPPEVIDFSKKILQIDKSNIEARKRIERYYRTVYSGCGEIENLLHHIDLRRSENILKSLEYLERLIKFLPGKYASHKSWGVGKIRSIDLLFNKIFIDFPTQSNHPITIDTAFDILTPLDDEHFIVQKIENREYLKTLLREDPAQLLRLILENEEPLSQDRALILLGGLVKKDEWQSFIKSAKKSFSSLGIEYQKKGSKYLFFKKSKKKKKRPSLEGIQAIPRSLDRYDILLSVSKDNLKETEKQIWHDHGLQLIQDKSIPLEKRVELLFIMSEVSEGKEKKSTFLKDILQNTTKDEKMTIVESLSQRRYKTEFLSIVSETDTLFAESVFLQVTDDQVRKHALKIIEREKGIKKLQENIFQNPNKYPLCFLFLLEMSMKIKEKVTEKPIYLFETLLEFMIKKDENKRIQHRAKTIFNKYGFDIFRSVLDTSSQEEISVLIDSIKKSLEIISEDKEVFERLAGAKHPSLKEREESEIFYATRRSISQKRKELDHLVKVEIPSNSEAIGKAASQGDLSENFDYISAKEKQRKLIDRVSLLKRELSNVHPIEEIHFVEGEVRVGTRILIEEVATHEKREIIILGPWDTVPDKEVVSHTAPYASLLLGKKEGETFTDKYNKRTYTIVRVKKYIP
jgi:transcription elongation factor GreA-like protein/transcription elongation GreA/GreB family factor